MTEPRVGLLRRARLPGEIATRRVAIMNYCRACMAFEGAGQTLRREVAACTCTECWLWPYRLGKPDVSDVPDSQERGGEA